MAGGRQAYDVPLALTIISSISIGIAVIISLGILLDIIWRRGWRSMMAVMIPVYVVNALYLWPITLWTYLQYGRPPKWESGGDSTKHHQNHHPTPAPIQEKATGDDSQNEDCEKHSSSPSTPNAVLHALNGLEGGRAKHRPSPGPSQDSPHNAEAASHGAQDGQHDRKSHLDHQSQTHSQQHAPEEHENQHRGDDGGERDSHQHQHHHQHGGERPMFATVTIAVCHCGAGCVIGDVIGEWIVYGANVTIRGRFLWPEFLIDFIFAVVIGVFFQYFSIAPMSGDYGFKTVYRAVKADLLSLLFFEIGLFGWMAIYQIAIFNWRLQTNAVTYWWMMQIGMFLGHWTAIPINWWLIKAGVKEPCA